ncbi:MAG: hypothetical protein JSV51_00235 [Candidatus Bathyarchaeota archaeon]|nr:MAG: hypothetical protein JSV51_00235 [Candidatus Bathyarchaeota archaeon]
MKVAKARKKVTLLPKPRMLFTKLNAALQTTKAPGAYSASKEKRSFWEATGENCKTCQFEAEYLKTRAEEFAQRLRQRLM